MKKRLGNIIYRVTSVLVAFFLYRCMPSIRSEFIPEQRVMLVGGIACVVWGVAWIARYLLSGNKSIRF
jgi:hypothetical protein